MVLKPYRRDPSKYVGQAYGEWSRNQQAPFIPEMFGARGDGVTNDTRALLTMFDAMYTQGHPGLITSPHVVNEGTLKWEQKGGVHVPGPVLYTAGHAELIGAGVADAPLLSIFNNDPGLYVRTGYIGALTYRDTHDAPSPNRHGLYLSGVQDMHFGPIHGEHTKGHLVYIPDRTFEGNGDFFHVYNCYFEQIEDVRGSGYTFYNASQNQLVNICYFQNLSNVFGKGIWYGSTGAANTIFFATCNACTECALNFKVNVGTCSILTILGGELDMPRAAINLEGIINFKIDNVRINSRRNTGAGEIGSDIIPLGETWPIKSVTFPNAPGQQVYSGTLNLIHRLNTEITNDSMFPIVTDFDNNYNVYNVKMKHTFLAGFIVSKSRVFTNMSPLSYDIVITKDRRKIFDSWHTENVVVRYTGNIGNAGYYTNTSRVIFNTVLSDPSIIYPNYDTTTGIYTVPVRGYYDLFASIRLTMAATTVFKMAFMRTRAGVVTGIHEYNTQAPNAASNTYQLRTTAYFEAGDQIWLSATQATGAPIAVDAGTDANANNHLEIVHVMHENE